MNKLFFTIFLSILLVSCEGVTSSNTRTTSQTVLGSRTGSAVINTRTVNGDGSTDIKLNGAVFRLDTDGTAQIIEDPNGNANITENNGLFTFTSGDADPVTLTPDGEILNLFNDAR